MTLATPRQTANAARYQRELVLEIWVSLLFWKKFAALVEVNNG